MNRDERASGGDDPSARAFAECDRAAAECALASGLDAYADGFRAAGQRMRREIARLGAGRARTSLERDVRDAEVEAQTLARVVAVAERIVAELGLDDAAGDGVRAVVAEFFDDDDLPSSLRVRAEDVSSTRVTGSTAARFDEDGSSRG